MIYLDNAATTWPKPESVYQAVEQYMRHLGASPGRGGHSKARAAGYILYEARELLAQLFGIQDPNRISFMHNATDAINTALFGLLSAGDTVVTTAMEHNAVARPLRALEKQGVVVRVAKCGRDGRVDLADMERLLAAGAKAVVMTHASNVTGTLMPVQAAGELARRHGAVMIVDAAQTAGIEPIDVASMAIDVLAFSGHKGLLGPQGTGGLYVRPGLNIKPLRFGGTGSLSESDRQPDFLPDCLESGTANTPGIAGLAAGVRFILATGIEAICAWERRLAGMLFQGLAEIPGVSVLGPTDPNLRTAVVAFTLGNMDSSLLSYRLDEEYGIISRGGLHCAPWAHQTLGTTATGAVRLSPGWFTTEAEIAAALKAVRALAREGVST
ncbi:MAG: aminotransferase class V-fold PLP-dependent enzyme [Negativicutes bacterium]|nr:aminotransferase class V-fold PLP-dependent enzyme [Negativicutes bacterium]